MKHKFIFLIYLALLAGVSNILAQTAAPDDVIKVETTLVSVPVIVSDRQGRYVPNLKAADFAVYQDGVKQNIEFFAATDEPLTVALLIDTSHSTRDVLDDIKDSAVNFLNLLQPRDKAMVVSFDFQTRVLSSLTADRDQLKRAVENAEIGEYAGTTLRDAVSDVVNRSFAGIKGRKAIILLTDGKDAGSEVSADNLFYSLEESDTLIYTIFYQTGRRFSQNRAQFPGRMGGMRDDGVFGGRFPNGGRRFPNQDRQFPPFPDDGIRAQRRERMMRKNEEAQEFLQKISDETAGRFYPSEVTNLKKTFGKIVEELRYQYRLGFYPANESSDKTLHELKVKVALPETVVRARNSYRVQGITVLPAN